MLKHIVFVSREYRPSRRCGGIGSYVTDMATAIAESGIHVTVICASDDTRKVERNTQGDLTVIRLPGGDFCVAGVEAAPRRALVLSYLRSYSRYGSYRRSVARELSLIQRTNKPDLVVAADYGAELDHWVALVNPIPYVITCQGPTFLDRVTTRRQRFSLKRLYLRKTAVREYELLRRANGLYAPSRSVADFIARDAAIDSKRICIIPNAIQHTEWARPICSVTALTPSAFRILFAGTITRTKGVWDLIEAVRHVRRSGLDVTLLLAGRPGFDGLALTKAKNEHPANYEWLDLTGDLSRSDLRALYRSADLVCIPSWWDNFPLACLEAMSSGGLVLASNRGGMGEIVTDGHDGFLCEPRDPTALAQAIRIILSLSAPEKLSLRQHAQESIACRFDVSVIVPKTLAFFESVVSGYHATVIAN